MSRQRGGGVHIQRRHGGAGAHRLFDPTPSRGGQFGWSLEKTDYNKDGVPDLYVGSSPHHTPDISQNGGTYVFDGRNGSLLKALELPPSDSQPGVPGNLGPNLGWGLAAPGDLNGDGEPDYVGGAPFFDVGSNQDQGRMYVFLSRVTPTAPRAGRCANDRTGTEGDDQINGTAAGDNVFALGGNDVINGLQADDCLFGGNGRDRATGSEGSDLVQGDAGNDSLSGVTGNDLVNGGSGRDRRFGGTGNDRLSGGSDRDLLRGGAGGDRLTGGSGNDSLTGDTGTNRYSAGSGNDRIQAANGRRETVNCGPGRDVVRADRSDRLIRCEQARRTSRRR